MWVNGIPYNSSNLLLQESLEQLSLDEEKDVDEMWVSGGEAAHDLPDHAATRTP